MSGSGYSTDTDSMAYVKVRLDEQLEEIETLPHAFSSSAVEKADFGRVHAESFEPYNDGVEQVTQALKGLAGEMRSLSEGIGGAAKLYSATERETTGNVRQVEQ